MKVFIKNLKKWFYSFKEFVYKNFCSFKEMIGILILFFSIIKDNLYYDAFTREGFRDYFKNFLKILAYFILGWEKLFLFIKLIYKKYGPTIFYYIFKYVSVFVFICWIIFESFFLRFYLVDTPFDSKMSQFRKEKASGIRRFIPIIFYESIAFMPRPFFRFFNTFLLVLSNLEAVIWLIYMVYIKDFFELIKFFLFIFIDIFFLFLNFTLLFISKFVIELNKLSFIILLFYVRFSFNIKAFIDFFNYIFILPFLLFNHFCRGIVHFIPKMYLFFFKLFKWKEFQAFKNDPLLMFIRERRNLKYSDSFIFGNISYNKIFDFIYNFEIFTRYIKFKLTKYDKEPGNMFIFLFALNNKIEKFNKKFKLNFLLLILYYFYLFFCYILCFFIILCLGSSYIYFPFFT
jgi:hypothetical protein